MRALITAGGQATRLRPITYTLNKHLIPLVNKPMIFYAIENIAKSGIKEIFINVNPGEKEIQKVVGDGYKWGVKISYIEQVGGPKGLAHIIKNAEPYLRGEPFVFYLGDNIVFNNLNNFMNRFVSENFDCMLAFAKVPDPHRFGVPVLENGRILRIEEKPQIPKSDFAQAGIYFYNDSIFKAVSSIEPSGRGEYEISDANTYLIQNGFKVGWEEITGWWKDTGKPEDLIEGNMLLMDDLHVETFKIDGTIGPKVITQGKVKIGKYTTIWDSVLIRGPVVIGDNCVIKNSYIGPYTSIGNNCLIENTEIENSVVFDRATLNTNARIVDSIIGLNANIGSSKTSLPLGHKLIIGDNSQVEI